MILEGGDRVGFEIVELFHSCFVRVARIFWRRATFLFKGHTFTTWLKDFPTVLNIDRCYLYHGQSLMPTLVIQILALWPCYTFFTRFALRSCISSPLFSMGSIM